MSLLYFQPTAGDLSVTKEGPIDDNHDPDSPSSKVWPLLCPRYFGQNHSDLLRRTEEFGDCSASNDLLEDVEIVFARPGYGAITHRKATNHAYKHIANKLSQLQSLVRSQAKKELRQWKQKRSAAFATILAQARRMPKYKRWTEMKVRYDPIWSGQTAWTLHPLTDAWTPIIPPNGDAYKLFGVDRVIYDPRFVSGVSGKVQASKPKRVEVPIYSQIGATDPTLLVGAYQYRVRLRKLNAKQAARARRSGSHYPREWVREQQLTWLRDNPLQESRLLTDLRRKVFRAQLDLEDARASQECVHMTREFSAQYIHELDRAIVGKHPTTWGLYGPALRAQVARVMGADRPYVLEPHGSLSPLLCVPITYISGTLVSDDDRKVRFTFNCWPNPSGFEAGYSDRNAIDLAVKPDWSRYEGKRTSVAIDKFVDAPDQSAANALLHRKYFNLADYVVRASVDDIAADRAAVEMKDLPATMRSTSEFFKWCAGHGGRMTLQKGAAAYLAWKFGFEPLQRDVAKLVAHTRRGVATWRRAFVQLYKGVYSLVASPSTVKSFFTIGRLPKGVYALTEKPASYVSLYLPVFSDSPLAGWHGDIRRENGWMSWYDLHGNNITRWFNQQDNGGVATDRVPDTREYYARYLAGKVVQLSDEHIRWVVETLLVNGPAGLWRGLVHYRPGALCCMYFREKPEWFLKGCMTRSDRTAWDKILGWAADSNLFQVGWEVTSLSFVLDWFLNTHDLAVCVNNMTRAAADGSRTGRAPSEIWGHDRFDWSGLLQMPENIRIDVRFPDMALSCRELPGWGDSWDKPCHIPGLEVADIQRWRQSLGFAPLDLASDTTWRLDKESLQIEHVAYRAMEIRLYIPHPARAFPTLPRIATRFRRGKLGLRSNEVWDALKPRIKINLDWGKLITLAALVLSR